MKSIIFYAFFIFTCANGLAHSEWKESPAIEQHSDTFNGYNKSWYDFNLPNTGKCEVNYDKIEMVGIQTQTTINIDASRTDTGEFQHMKILRLADNQKPTIYKISRTPTTKYIPEHLNMQMHSIKATRSKSDKDLVAEVCEELFKTLPVNVLNDFGGAYGFGNE